MLIFFENYRYSTAQIEPYLGGLKILKYNEDKSQAYTESIGYIFIAFEEKSYPVFILPKSFLIAEEKRLNVLGMKGIYPEDVIDTDSEDNPLELAKKGTFLPELGIWLFRALNRFRLENANTILGQQANLDSQLPEDNSRDKDFLSTALDLIDFLKDHRNLFTQISLINHSGRNKIDWGRTIAKDAYIENDEPWYLSPVIKDKVINIDEELIILYYSVLRYLRDKYKFPINLGEVPYQLLPPAEVQRLIDTGVGSKTMRRIRHNYFREDLKHLWGLLDSFFAFNSSDENKEKRKEQLLVKNFEVVFERMVDSLISDSRGVEKLKKQDDGKLIDHIFRYTSLLGTDSDIYYIGDSKYYDDRRRPEGVALYKQFTYAKNTIQFHIDNLYLYGQPKNSRVRYRDYATEGYNISPNFFIRSRVTEEDANFDKPTLRLTFWDEDKGLRYPPTNKHFPDRIFDRDTLILREFSINLLFVIAAYAGYEDTCWHSEIHSTIRKNFIDCIETEYEFWKLTPKDLTPEMFMQLYFSEIYGRAYRLADDDTKIILAFERTDEGKKNFNKLRTLNLREVNTGKLVEFNLEQISLAKLI